MLLINNISKGTNQISFDQSFSNKLIPRIIKSILNPTHLKFDGKWLKNLYSFNYKIRKYQLYTNGFVSVLQNRLM